MYKAIEAKSLRLLRRGIKGGAPEWLVGYCKYLLVRASHYRAEADHSVALKSLGKEWKSARYKKAVDHASVVGDLMSAFLLEHNKDVVTLVEKEWLNRFQPKKLQQVD